MKKEQITIQKVQDKCNEFIRLRDKDKPCISCGQFKLLQAGHFYAVSGYAGLRFDEVNINGECMRCNCFDGSHLITYRDNLVERIGQAEFKALQERASNYKKFGKKFSKSELLEIYNYYCEKIKQLKNEL